MANNAIGQTEVKEGLLSEETLEIIQKTMEPPKAITEKDEYIRPPEDAIIKYRKEKDLYKQGLHKEVSDQNKQSSLPNKSSNINLNNLAIILIPLGILLAIFIILRISGFEINFANSWDYFTGKYVIKKKGGTLVVIDGDTFWSKRHSNKIRILGIDCPEVGEPGYQEAKDFLYELLESSSLRIKEKGIDRYGRLLAEVFVNGENVALKMKEKGFDKLDGKYKERFLEPSKISSDTVKEEYRCETCHRRISEEEYDEFNGLCRWCRGAPTQKGFPSPPGFPKM